MSTSPWCTCWVKILSCHNIFQKMQPRKKKKKKKKSVAFHPKLQKNNIFSFPPTNELTDPDMTFCYLTVWETQLHCMQVNDQARKPWTFRLKFILRYFYWKVDTSRSQFKTKWQNHFLSLHPFLVSNRKEIPSCLNCNDSLFYWRMLTPASLSLRKVTYVQ